MAEPKVTSSGSHVVWGCTKDWLYSKSWATIVKDYFLESRLSDAPDLCTAAS